MRRAKILATLGPASNTKEKIQELIQAGVNGFRLNFSHGSHDSHRDVIKNIRAATSELGVEIAVLQDLQGPKIRVDKLNEPLELKNEEEWYIGLKENQGKIKNFIPTVYENLVADSEEGCTILFDDGLIEAKAIKKEKNNLKVKVIVGGILKSNKGINLPDIQVSAPSFTAKDKEDLFFGLSEGVDYIALSFIRTAKDILEVKYLMHKMKINIPIIAKVERPEAVLNIKEIIKVADVIMVARGDMGVEVGNHKVPSIQKNIISLCNSSGVPVITATQMLESMSDNSRPTRAEASDVANAIWDGTDVVMLSGETASGKYPVKTVKTMSNIILEAEKMPKERPLLRNTDLSSTSASLQAAASLIAEKGKAQMIISVTQTGNSCFKMARFRPRTRVMGVSNDISVVRKMSLFWGIQSYYFDDTSDKKSTIEKKLLEYLKAEKILKNGDRVVVTRGDGKYFNEATSNSVQMIHLKDVKKEGVGQNLDIVDVEKGRIQLDRDICASCQNCVNICPHGIWGLDSQKNTIIDENQAPNCSFDLQCVEVCPTGAIEILNYSS